MPYTPTNWVDEVPAGTPPVTIKYKITDDVGGVIANSAKIEIVTSITPGTPLNAANENKQELGIQTAQQTAEDAQLTADDAFDYADDAYNLAAAAIPKSLATAIGQIAYSTASGIWAALVKPTVQSVLLNDNSGALSWNAITNFVLKSIYTAAGDLLIATGSATPAVLAKPSTATGVLQETTAGVGSWRAIKQTVQQIVVPELTEVDTVSGVAYFYVPSTMNGYNLVRAQAMVKTAGTTGATTIQVRNMTKYPGNDALSAAISIASAGTVGTPGTVDAARDDVSTDDQIKIYVTAQSTTKPKGLWVVLEFQLP